MRIVPLREHAALLDTVAGWLDDAFLAPREDGHGLARALLAARLEPDAVPQAFVALLDGTPCGTVSLVWDEHPFEPGQRCCLAGLCVPPAWRGRGIGRRLCEHALAHAARLGQRDVLLFTADAERWYQARGWRILAHAVVTTLHGLQWCAVMQAPGVADGVPPAGLRAPAGSGILAVA